MLTKHQRYCSRYDIHISALYLNKVAFAFITIPVGMVFCPFSGCCVLQRERVHFRNEARSIGKLIKKESSTSALMEYIKDTFFLMETFIDGQLNTTRGIYRQAHTPKAHGKTKGAKGRKTYQYKTSL